MGKVKKKVKDYEFNYTLFTVILLVIMAVFAFVGFYQLKIYDDNILEIYADQQDDYVQLVLDQINMKKYYSDEEIIEDILNSLDVSGQKYWTLSKEESILFVKDVTETYRYKGFTTETYYISESAGEFLDSLNLNYVTHQLIVIDGDLYVASGAAFEYHGDIYRICLLTNRTVILDNNQFLSSKITLWIVLILMISGAAIASLSLVTGVFLQREKHRRLKSEIARKNKTLETLGRELKAMEAYQARWNLFDEALVSAFSENLDRKKLYPLTALFLQFAQPGDSIAFLEKAQVFLDKKVLRFSPLEEDRLLLVFVTYSMAEAMSAMQVFMDGNLTVLASMSTEDGYESLEMMYDKMREKVGDNGNQHLSGIQV